jgi:hypothetical protein
LLTCVRCQVHCEPTQFSICASNAYAATVASATIRILPRAPRLRYGPLSFVDGEFHTCAAIVDGVATAFSVVSGSLPEGLALDAKTGAVLGTPARFQPPSIVAIEAANGGGTDAYNAVIIIQAAPLPQLEYPATLVMLQGRHETVNPKNSGGAAARSKITVTPDLPAGLSIDRDGVISGAPTVSNVALLLLLLRRQFSDSVVLPTEDSAAGSRLRGVRRERGRQRDERLHSGGPAARAAA